MKVAICTPTRDCKVHVNHMMSNIMCAYNKPPDLQADLYFLQVPGQANIPRARNQLVAQALHAGCQRIWFIDDDISYNPADFWRITARPEAFIAGLPMRRPGSLKELYQQPILMGRFADNEPPHPGENGLVEALDVPTAFLCLDRSVFDTLKPDAFKFELPQLPAEVNEFCRSYFSSSYESDYQITDGEMPGEDYFFSTRWRKAGGTVWVDPDVRLGHHDGLFNFDLSYRMVLETHKRKDAA